MSARYDKVIRNGTIVDGSGEPRYAGDVAIIDGRIAAVGKVKGGGTEEIDARDLMVTPGFAVGRLEMVRDLPNGGGRIGQDSCGYVATLVAGEVTYREGVPTGALPGRLVRGAQGNTA